MDGDSSFDSKIVMTTQRCAGAHNRYEIYRTNPRKSRKRENWGGVSGVGVGKEGVEAFLLIIEQIDGGDI
jgi:hypothetical protein